MKMSNYIEIPACRKSHSTPILINLDNIIVIKRYEPENSSQALLSFRYGNKKKALIVEFDTMDIRDEYYEKIKRLLINTL